MAAIARWGAELPGAAIDVRIGSPWALGAGLRGRRPRRCGASCGWRGRRGGRVCIAAALALALAGRRGARVGRRRRPRPRQFTVTFLDVGQGDATLLQTPDGAAVLVDGGPPGTGLAGKLRDRGVRALDVVVLTHAQEDHQGGLADVLASFDGRPAAGRRPAATTAPTIAASCRSPGPAGREVRAARAGQRFRVGRELRLRVMAAAGPDSSPTPIPTCARR